MPRPLLLILLLYWPLGLAPISAQVKKGPGAVKAMKGAKKAQVIDRFQKMTPEQREKALAKLPPERQEQIRKNLQTYNGLTPDQKAQIQKQYEMLQQLPPERRQAARQAFRQMNNLPPDRRQEVKKETNRLSRMPEDKRKARLESEDFKSKYSPEEQKMIEELSSVVPGK